MYAMDHKVSSLNPMAGMLCLETMECMPTPLLVRVSTHAQKKLQKMETIIMASNQKLNHKL